MLDSDFPGSALAPAPKDRPLKVYEVNLQGDDRGDIPEWLWSYTRFCMRTLGIYERAYITLRSPDNMDGASGGNYVSHNMAQSILYFPTDIDPESPETWDTILHEVLHIMDADVLAAHASIVELVPEAFRDHAKTLLHRHWERNHDRLSMVIAPLIYKSWQSTRAEALKPAQALPEAAPEA